MHNRWQEFSELGLELRGNEHVRRRRFQLKKLLLVFHSDDRGERTKHLSSLELIQSILHIRPARICQNAPVAKRSRRFCVSSSSSLSPKRVNCSRTSDEQ